MRSLMICTPHSFFGDEIEMNEMDRACTTYEKEERRTLGFGGKT
jgi:hypothetical protein